MGMREKIKENAVRQYVKEPVPEWGLDVYLRSMSAGEREEYFDQIVKRQHGEEQILQTGLRAWVLARTVCDEDKVLQYDDKTIGELMECDPLIVERLFDRALEISCLTDKSREVLEKNSSTTQNAPSSSG